MSDRSSKTRSFHKTIALVFDFDDTLAPDSTSAFLESIGVDAKADFWPCRVQPLVHQGWDPLPAQYFALLEESQRRPSSDRITGDKLAAFGRHLTLFEGVGEIFSRLRAIAKETNTDAKLEFHIISCGIAEIIRQTSIAHEFKSICANEFHQDETGAIVFPKILISHTEKTRYLFKIALGLNDQQFQGRSLPGQRQVAEADLHVPLRQFVYVGDGLTDIPCFDLIASHHGISIGVDKEHGKWGDAAGFTRENRVANLVPPDYREGAELPRSLALAVEAHCKRIDLAERSIGE